MSDIKQKLIDGIIKVEGGYVNDPSDSGGETNYGITRAVARAAGYGGNMRDMPRSVAFGIYAARYWDKLMGDELSELSELVAGEVVDTGVNMGTGRAGKFLQRALNALNNRGTLYADLVVDGDVGPATVKALRSYMQKRNDDETLAKMLNCLQGAFYVELAERREKDEKFVYGWYRNRVAL